MHIFKICIMEQTERKKNRSKVSLLPEAIYKHTAMYYTTKGCSSCQEPS